MDTQMLAARSGEPVELTYIVILVAHCCFPCLSRNVCLSLSHTVALLVFHTVYICPCRTLLLSLSTDAAAL